MTRRLPWKRDSGLARQSPKLVLAPSDDKTAASPASRIKKEGNVPAARTEREGSTSPPPEPLQESFMIEGLHEDDGYRMVEDELLATAQQFTAHLHAVEYQRLKAASRAQDADAFQNIPRAVVGPMSMSTIMKQERFKRLERQKMATDLVAAAEGTKREEDDTFQSRSLYGMMESPRKKLARLDAIAPIPFGTRMAAGFKRKAAALDQEAATPELTAPKRQGVAVDLQDDEEIDEGSLQNQGESSTGPGATRTKAFTTTPRGARRATEPSDDSDSNGDPFGHIKKSRRKTRDRRSLETSKDIATRQPKKASHDLIPDF